MESETLNLANQTSNNSDSTETEQTEFEKNQKKYQELIAKLPTTKGWRPSEILSEFGGHWWQQSLLEGLLHAKEYFQARPTDFLICSYPKTGTTWLKALTFAISNRSKFGDDDNPLRKRFAHEFVPYVEIDFAFFPQVDVLKDQGNSLFSTHIPYGSLPDSILDSGCKMVYIWRDPKDTFISMWTFLHKEKSQDGELASLEEAFDMFCQGLSVYGPYLDHVLEYWKGHSENPERIMFLKYEEMRADPIPYVRRLAEFMGHGFSAEEEETGAVEKVVNLCSFETLKNVEANKGDKEREDRPAVYANSAYFRKGKVGDWQNYLTPEMAARIDGIMAEKFKGTDLIQKKD
ncbi:PREDICTED: cytosolic sulfotransferase 16-like [Tarenaya hassleriana]|uniref:cytosolic sulfotransferase 16-like n=1 Tax=Tarenaya hassleriana TaxID=28532 RepID=UPI00053C5C19|nr:PREDICTED: cytosolic sulfotransferase 16-like [Tarenaya hassleriana]